MHVLYPLNPLMRKLPEPLFEPEFDAARSMGLECLLFDEDKLVRETLDDAVRSIPHGTGIVIYRGWILAEERYKLLEMGLASRGYQLLSSTTQYAAASYFPNYYSKIQDCSPRAVWTDSSDTYQAWHASRTLGDGPFVLKDHIKSAKHCWHDACFVPKGTGREQFEFIAQNLKTEQGSSFNRGFVVKEYVPLVSAGDGPREYPQSEEYRLFFLHGQLLTLSHYFRVPEQVIDPASFVEIASRFESPFFTLDIAHAQDGRWLVIDVGSGESSALPPNLSPVVFYQRILQVLATR